MGHGTETPGGPTADAALALPLTAEAVWAALVDGREAFVCPDHGTLCTDMVREAIRRLGAASGPTDGTFPEPRDGREAGRMLAALTRWAAGEHPRTPVLYVGPDPNDGSFVTAGEIAALGGRP